MIFNNKDVYDAIIIGAGPGGLRMADNLTMKGFNVLVLDKKQEIGTPKRCAEGVGGGWIERLRLEPSKKWISEEIYGARLYAPNGKEIDLIFDNVSGYVLERKIFEKELAKIASNNGATIYCKNDVIKAERKDGIVEITAEYFGEEIKYKGKIIVSAEGVEAKIARMLGVRTNIKVDDYDSGFQYEMTNINLDRMDLIHMWFGHKTAPRGYIWVFPKGNKAGNVGIGVSGSLKEKNARYYLDKYINENPEKFGKSSVIEVNAGGIPVGDFLETMVADNLIVIGDAAHQVNPIHGGGIALAMEAADIASPFVEKALKEKNYKAEAMLGYNKEWYDKRGNKLKIPLKTRHMFENMKDEDMNKMADLFTAEEILTIAEGNRIDAVKLVTKKLITKPDLLSFVLKFINS